MQRQDDLLRVVLDGDELRAGLLTGSPDRSSIRRICLVAQDERTDGLRSNQANIVAEIQELPAPLMAPPQASIKTTARSRCANQGST